MSAATPNTAIVYHQGCPDGFGAAWAVHKAGIPAAFHGIRPSDPPPRFAPEINRLYILDVSFDRDVIMQLASHYGPENVTLLDHHETAAAELAGLDNCVVDQSKAGSVLAWEHFHPGQPVPHLLEYVQDRDLWQWQLPDSQAVSAYLHSQRMKFEGWTRIHNALRRGKQSRQSIIDAGYDILRLETRAVSIAVKHAVWGHVAGYQAPVANSPQHRSEIGHRLLERYPDAPFAAVYYDQDGQRHWSLRSMEGRVNVAQIAELYGGGGHAHAAGFSQIIAPISVPAPAA